MEPFFAMLFPTLLFRYSGFLRKILQRMEPQIAHNFSNPEPTTLTPTYEIAEPTFHRVLNKEKHVATDVSGQQFYQKILSCWSFVKN